MIIRKVNRILHSLAKLPVMLVFMMALLIYVIDATGVGAGFSFTNSGFVSVAIFLFGLGIIAIGGYTFRKANTTVNPMNPENTTCLVTTGIYRISRNPMYIGFFLWLLACVIYVGNIINILLLPVFIMLVNKLFILPEEDVLGNLFGEEFFQYKNKVRRWL